MQGDKCCLRITMTLSGDFTVKQGHAESRPLTVTPADLAKVTTDVFWGWGEMLRREKLSVRVKLLVFTACIFL